MTTESSGNECTFTISDKFTRSGLDWLPYCAVLGAGVAVLAMQAMVFREYSDSSLVWVREDLIAIWETRKSLKCCAQVPSRNLYSL